MENKKVIWITGASSGIGRALAIKFANEDWTVIASARREDLLQKLDKENKNIHSYPLDVTNIEQCKYVFKSIIEKYSNIEISLFGTGMQDSKSEKSFKLEKVREIIEINYFGIMNSINSIYDYYSDKKSGQISIISSIVGYRGLPAAGAYCASKAALISFSESLYFDMKKKNVRVRLINPGFIKTPMSDKSELPMPMIESAEYAAEKIYIGLVKQKNFEIHFPKTLTIIMKVIRILPNWLYFGVINLGNKYMKRDR